MSLDRDPVSPLSAIDLIQKHLGESEGVRKHFARDLTWLEDRKRIWTGQKLRIGIVGITSSGKSTLVNALMDQHLLPHAVRPSSNTLVLCQWGKTRRGRIFFLDPDRPAEAVEGDRLSERLRFFADEQSNPGNREGVKEILIETPDYRLGKDMIVVDTPGLDAYGLIEHEKLTLDVLLPTVDVVLFVTTCKANSDAKIAEYLGKAVEYGKSVIVAQNMIDSIVAKRDHWGEVKSTWSDVAQRHARRMLKVMEGQGVGAGALVQVSAQWAVQGRLQESRIPELVGMIDRRANTLRAEAVQGRLRQLLVRLDDIVARERFAGDDAGQHSQCRSELEALRGFAAEAETRYDGVRDKAAEALSGLHRAAQGLLRTIDSLRARDVAEARRAHDEMMRWLREGAKAPSSLWRELQRTFAGDCERLNLRREDVDFSIPRLPPAPPVSLRTVEREETYREAQDGLWGGLKRSLDFFDADWGYDERVRRWTEIGNLSEFRTRMKDAVKAGQDQLAGFLRLVTSRTEECREAVRMACLDQQAVIETRMRPLADAETRGRVAQSLARVADDLRAVVAVNPEGDAAQASPATGEDGVEVTVRPAALALVRLAGHIARQRFPGLREDRLSRIGAGPARRILITGFDADALEEFVTRYWFDALDGTPEPSLPCRLAGSGPAIAEVALAPLSDTDGEAAAPLVRDYCAFPFTLFLLVDPHQIGAASSQLARCRSAMPELFTRQEGVVLVVQSVRALLGADQVAAGLWELRGMLGVFGLRVDGVLVNDEETLFSDLADALLLARRPMDTLTDEMAWLGRLDEQDRALAVGILRGWRVLAAEQRQWEDA